jgi:hypothetical protein
MLNLISLLALIMSRDISAVTCLESMFFGELIGEPYRETFPGVNRASSGEELNTLLSIGRYTSIAFIGLTFIFGMSCTFPSYSLRAAIDEMNLSSCMF